MSCSPSPFRSASLTRGSAKLTSGKSASGRRGRVSARSQPRCRVVEEQLERRSPVRSASTTPSPSRSTSRRRPSSNGTAGALGSGRSRAGPTGRAGAAGSSRRGRQREQVGPPVAVDVGQLHAGVGEPHAGRHLGHRPRPVEPAAAEVAPEPGGAVQLDEVGQPVAEQADRLQSGVGQRARRQRVPVGPRPAGSAAAPARTRCSRTPAAAAPRSGSPSWPTIRIRASSEAPLAGSSAAGPLAAGDQLVEVRQLVGADQQLLVRVRADLDPAAAQPGADLEAGPVVDQRVRPLLVGERHRDQESVPGATST